MYPHNSRLTPNAQSLRKRMTKEEKHLWYDFLRKYPIKFTRQMVLGIYIADFYSAEAKTVLELDGSQHYQEKGIQNDLERDNLLNTLGITVLRYSNLDVNKNFEGVCKDILEHVSFTSSVTS